MNNPYQVLGVTNDVETEVIKKAYLNLAKQFHPDHNKGQEGEAEGKFKEILDAYETLRDPEKRAVCDKRLREKSDLAFLSHFKDTLLQNFQADKDLLNDFFDTTHFTLQQVTKKKKKSYQKTFFSR